MAARAASSRSMPARMTRGLSRSGRRGSEARVGPGGGGGGNWRAGIAIYVKRKKRVALVLLLCVEQILQLGHELADVAEVPVDRRKSHVRHFIQLLQFLHHVSADLRGRHL